MTRVMNAEVKKPFRRKEQAVQVLCPEKDNNDDIISLQLMRIAGGSDFSWFPASSK
jgi:hypothetical protein